MSIPFVIDNQHHRMADALKELLTQTEGKPLDIATPRKEKKEKERKGDIHVFY